MVGSCVWSPRKLKLVVLWRQVIDYYQVINSQYIFWHTIEFDYTNDSEQMCGHSDGLSGNTVEFLMFDCFLF